jgi:putative ABC transport system permease protein
MKYLRYIVRNVLRNKLRSLLTIMAIWLSLMIMTFLYGYLAQMEVWGREAEKYNRVVVMNIQGFAAPVPLATLDYVRTQDYVVAAVPFSWYGGKYRNEQVFFAQFGTDPDYVFEVWSEYSIPRDQLAAFKADRQACVCDRKLAENYGWKIGEHIRLEGTIYPFDLDLKLVGIFDPPEDAQTLFFNLKYLDEGLRSQGSPMAGNCGTIFLRAASADVIADLCRRIDGHFANSRYPTNTQTERAFAQMFVKMAGNVQNFILFIGVFVTIALTLVAANGMAMSIRERTTEIAVMRAIGFQRGQVLGVVLGEAVAIALIGGLLGVAAGRGIYALAHNFAPMLIQMSRMPWAVMGWGIAVSMGIGLASGMEPAWRAARLPVVDGLRRVI